MEHVSSGPGRSDGTGVLLDLPSLCFESIKHCSISSSNFLRTLPWLDDDGGEDLSNPSTGTITSAVGRYREVRKYNVNRVHAIVEVIKEGRDIIKEQSEISKNNLFQNHLTLHI